MIYESFADLLAGYLETLKGRASHAKMLYVSRQWVGTLTRTPTRTEILARHLAKGHGHCEKGAAIRPTQANPYLFTLASCLSNELQVDDVTIRAILNHADGSALSHYCFKSFDSLTGPIQAYADWVWNLPGTIPEPEGRLDRPRVWDEDAELMEVPG